MTLNPSNGSQVLIPDVVGKSIAEAQATLAAAGLGSKITGTNTFGATVASVAPATGSAVPLGTQITLTTK